MNVYLDSVATITQRLLREGGEEGDEGEEEREEEEEAVE